MQELLRQIDEKEYASLQSLKGDFAFTCTKYPANCLTWIGASIQGSVGGIDRFAKYPKELPTF
jgi:hypothetical protein